ncbi:MAG: tetratricopeptide repeat protein [Janthinobacterium lividum]
MYCQDCNTGNSVDSKYCKECGTKINSGYRTMMLSIQDLPLDQTEESIDRLTRLLDMAFWHNQAGNQEAAITASEAALALNPNSTTAHSLLGTLYEKKGDDAQAIRHFEAVLALNPDSPADAAKLDQLRRGIHVRATAPPVAYQWLPPVLLKLRPQFQQKLSALAGAPLAVNIGQVDPQRRPFYAAGAATAVALALGLLLTHPWAQAEAVKTYPITASAAPAAVSINQSAFGTGTQMASASPPMVLMPSRGNSESPSYSPPPITTRDPFAGQIPAPYSAPTASSTDSSRWMLPSGSRSAGGHRRETGQELPPLRLAALPAVGSDSVAPAPVSLPPGIVPVSVIGSVPQHTVMVGSFGSPPSPSVSNSGSDLSSHIRISVHQDSDTGTPASVASASSPSESSPAGSSGQGETYQQRALSLQESGSYPQARQAYQSAIRSYQMQIALGQNVETAQRGLAACQTGLQICQQSQQ